jgi:hypothetical protein
MVREIAARVLGATGAPSASVLEALLDATEDPHQAVRFRAVQAFERLEACDEPVLARLRVLERDDEVRHVKRAAYKALKALDAVARERARRARPEPSEAFVSGPLSAAAARAEGERLGPERVLELLADGRAVVRANALRAVSLAADPGGLARKVLELLRDADLAVRVAATVAIASERLDPGRAVPQLLEALVGARPPFDEALVAAVAAYASDAHGPLVATLDDRAYKVLRTTGRVAPALGEELGATLARCLAADRPLTTRRNAAAVLGLMGRRVGSVATSALLAALTDPTPSLRLEAVNALARVEPGPIVAARLREMLRGEHRASLHHAVQRALRNMPG